MTDLPYTDDDLRYEAARQLFGAQEDPDFMGVGEQMEYAAVAHTEDGEDSLTWQQLLVPEGGGSWETFGEAQRKIHGLINGAADVSEWAINLGADGLEPSDEHALTIDGDGKPLVRVHFAFEPGMPEEMRDAFVLGIGQAIDAQLPEGGDR